MRLPFVSTTTLQKSPKTVLGKKPAQLLLTNNKLSGMVLSRELTEKLLASQVLEQVLEELREIHDTKTTDLIRTSRSGTKKMIPLSDFRRKYGV